MSRVHHVLVYNDWQSYSAYGIAPLVDHSQPLQVLQLLRAAVAKAFIGSPVAYQVRHNTQEGSRLMC